MDTSTFFRDLPALFARIESEFNELQSLLSLSKETTT